jgi:hypothetical protein
MVLSIIQVCEPALDIDHTSASNSDQLVTQQSIGRFENIPRIPWSGLPADMISNLVNQGCRFTGLGNECTGIPRLLRPP